MTNYPATSAIVEKLAYAKRFYESYKSHSTHKLLAMPEKFIPPHETRPPTVVANILICLIHQTNYLLDQQLRQLEKAFLKEGGLR